MKIEDSAIVDFYLENNVEAEILKCFLSENEKLLFHCWEYFILPDSEVDIATKEYIISRTKIVSEINLFETVYHKNNEVSYWYEPINQSELINEIYQSYYDYVCIVIENGKDISDYKYLLTIEENYPDEEGEECRALLIKERVKGTFQNDILPRIKKVLKPLY